MQAKNTTNKGDVKDNLSQMYAVGVMSFVLFLSSLVGLPVLPALSRELGADASEAAFVVSAAMMTLVVVQFFSGILADRYSKRRLILTGALIGSVSSLLCVVATHWTQLALLRIIGGIADAISMPALLAITASLGKKTPGKFFGILRGSQGLSFVVGPALGAVFSLISLRAPFVIDGVLSLIAFFVATRMVKTMEKVKSTRDLSVFRGIRITFSAPHVYLFLLLGIAGLFGFGVLSSFVPIKSESIGLNAWQIGSILAGGAMTFSYVSLTVGKFSDRFNRKLIVILSQVVILVGCAGLALSNEFLTLLFFYCLFCIGEATTFLLSFVYAGQIFSEKHVGTSMGAFNSVIDLSMFIAPLLAISIHEALGNFGVVIMFASVPAIFAFFASTIWLPRDSQALELFAITGKEMEPKG